MANFTSQALVFALVSLFGIGVLYLTFTSVFAANLVPILKSAANQTISDAESRTTVSAGIDKYMVFFHMLPFTLFIIVCVFMLAVVVRREGENL